MGDLTAINESVKNFCRLSVHYDKFQATFGEDGFEVFLSSEMLFPCPKR
jgi:hypothetical protein